MKTNQTQLKEIEKIIKSSAKGIEEFACPCSSCSKTRKRAVKAFLSWHQQKMRKLVGGKIDMIAIFHSTLKDLYGKELASNIMKQVNAKVILLRKAGIE